MKKTQIALSLICALVLTSCNNTLDNLEITTEITPTLLTTTEQAAIGSPAYSVSKEYPDWYYGLDGSLMDKVDQSLVDTEKKSYDIYFKYFVKTIDINPRSFCRYFGISKDEYKNIYAYMGNREDTIFKDDSSGDIYFDIDELFGTYEQLNSKFSLDSYKSLAVKSEENIPEGDTEHTYTYHTIHYTLIEYVGTEKYAKFKKQFAGTEDFNILNFIKYFGIDRPTYEKIISSDGWTDEYGVFHTYLRPYNPDYLYGDEDMIKEYFYCHPIK